MKIVVIGAGVVGLSTAVQIAEHYLKRDVQVTLISEAFSPNTTGDGSAGLWGPYYVGNTSAEKIVQWSGRTHQMYHKLWLNGEAVEAGITMQPMCRFTCEKDYSEPVWKNVVFGYQNLGAEALEKLRKEHQRDYTHGNNFVSFTCEPVKFLPYLMKRFLTANGKVVQKKVKDFAELSHFDIIVNCSGLGSRELTTDKDVHSIRGQVARVKSPWIFETFLDDSDDGNYVIVNTDYTILGGTHTASDYNLNISAEDNKFIYGGCLQMVKGLKHAPTFKEWVGLRPGRSEVRLEIENYKTKNGKTVKIVHNYGHGGCGVCLSWGCGNEVFELTKGIIETKSKL